MVFVLLEDEIDALADVLGDRHFRLLVQDLELSVLLRRDVDGRGNLLPHGCITIRDDILTVKNVAGARRGRPRSAAAPDRRRARPRARLAAPAGARRRRARARRSGAAAERAAPSGGRWPRPRLLSLRARRGPGPHLCRARRGGRAAATR